jgi:hypothetical protein
MMQGRIIRFLHFSSGWLSDAATAPCTSAMTAVRQL